MKTDIDIRDDVYTLLKGSPMAGLISGRLCKGKRDINSTQTDIVIAVVANQRGQNQQAYVNVNCYVPDHRRGVSDGIACEQWEEDTYTLRLLARAFDDFFHEAIHTSGARITLSEQRVYEIEGAHVIHNKILYQFNTQKI